MLFGEWEVGAVTYVLLSCHRTVKISTRIANADPQPELAVKRGRYFPDGAYVYIYFPFDYLCISEFTSSLLVLFFNLILISFSHLRAEHSMSLPFPFLQDYLQKPRCIRYSKMPHKFCHLVFQAFHKLYKQLENNEVVLFREIVKCSK